MNTIGNWEALVLGILIGAVLTFVWSDVISILNIASKAKHGSGPRDTLVQDTRIGFTQALPRWLMVVVIFTGLCTVIVGGAQVVQYNQFAAYQHCVEDRDSAQSEAQRLRTADLVKKEAAYNRWLLSVGPIFNENNTEPEKAFNKFKRRTLEAAQAQSQYLQTVRENPYPKPVREECGTVGSGE